MNFTKKQTIYAILLTVYSCMLIVSNILANRTFEIYKFMLPSAVIVFPIVYIINDVMTECFGFKNAKRTIITAFMLNLLAVIFFNIAIHLPTTQDFTNYNIVLGNTIKSLFASFIAYIVGSFINAVTMDKMKQSGSNKLMLRCVLSTLFGETCDAFIFITIMFLGVLQLNIVIQMIITQALFKTVYEIIVYPITKIVINKIKCI